ncbi:LOW QUALITY PROTEIN: B9 domain-containing protein 1-like [Nylanderia fulva]|uniref:LOW QUALITY PROTEIN: B9 domain-containing protein 1-like n=1 Tax=Nylanderia fulva TaxID=613905 RepID=UPI0010FAEED1|nr:LOW QUALITY PROTEIN: B9 domain-containing protein 1-like [Nylanderia fulva]
MSVEGQFFLSITGSIEHAEFYEADNVYCKYRFHFGPEWNVVTGIEEGLTQMCKCSNDPRNLVVWNFPLDITFKSTNPHGWPQLIMLIYGLDWFGRDVIRGYGVCHLPLKTGHHEKRVSVYVPESSSTLQRFMEWLTGRRPELIDPAILASGGGRELTRMRVEGVVTLTFNVVLKDLFKLGYDNGEKWKK